MPNRCRIGDADSRVRSGWSVPNKPLTTLDLFGQQTPNRVLWVQNAPEQVYPWLFRCFHCFRGLWVTEQASNFTKLGGLWS